MKQTDTSRSREDDYIKGLWKTNLTPMEYARQLIAEGRRLQKIEDETEIQLLCNKIQIEHKQGYAKALTEEIEYLKQDIEDTKMILGNCSDDLQKGFDNAEKTEINCKKRRIKELKSSLEKLK